MAEQDDESAPLLTSTDISTLELIHEALRHAREVAHTSNTDYAWRSYVREVYSMLEFAIRELTFWLDPFNGTGKRVATDIDRLNNVVSGYEVALSKAHFEIKAYRNEDLFKVNGIRNRMAHPKSLDDLKASEIEMEIVLWIDSWLSELLGSIIDYYSANPTSIPTAVRRGDVDMKPNLSAAGSDEPAKMRPSQEKMVLRSFSGLKTLFDSE